jgi:hypothetical protein
MRSLLLIFLLASAASGLEVLDVRWGFDGGVRGGRLNPLAIRVANPALSAFDGIVSLQRSPDLGGVGCPLQVALYLEPGGERWLRFAPFVFGVPESWQLRWGTRAVDSLAISATAHAKPARVRLSGESAAGAGEIGVFPAELLPGSVALMDALALAVLAHRPDWTPAQETGVADWLYAGGQLHLVGELVGFDGPLAQLNNPAAAFRVGRGLVQRHPDLASAESAAAQAPGAESYPRNKARATEVILGNLASLAHPEHNWTLIIFLVLGYVLLIGPANYLFARRVKDHRLALAFFVVSAIAFSAFIGIAGQKGYDSLSGTHAFTYARALEDHRFDTRKWTSIFSADGQQFAIRHPQPTYYSAASRFERIDGQIRNGVDGVFEVGVPMYSSRPFFSRGIREHRSHRPQLEWSRFEQGQLTELQVSLPVAPIAAWAIHGAVCHQLAAENGSLRIAETITVAEFTRRWRKHYDRPYRYGHAGRSVDTVMRAIAERIIQDEFLQDGPPPGHIALLLLSPTPHDLQLKAQQGGLETGQTLFHYELPERPFETAP